MLPVFHPGLANKQDGVLVTKKFPTFENMKPAVTSSFQNYNRYTYALNNPLKYVDPTGYQIAPVLQTQQYYYGGGFWIYGPYSSYSHGANNFISEGGGGNYYYDWDTGKYKSADGNVVSWNEVNNNYVTKYAAITYHLWHDYVGTDKNPYMYDKGISVTYSINKNWFLMGEKDQTGGGESNTLQTINTTVNTVSNTTAAISTMLTSTKFGSDITYTLSSSKIFLTSVKYLKPVGFVATWVGIFTDVGLSINGQQSWTETGINTGVTVGATIIGGWPGLIIQLDYIGAKTYMQTVNEHPEWILPASYHSFTH